jgi:putative ABC transport system substrate-binding protein
MQRREFITLVGAAATGLPLAAMAQTQGGPRKLGVLMAGSESAPENRPRVAAFRQALRDLGWNEGDNLRVEYRWSGGKSELISQYADELVALAPDVILANSTPVITAFKKLAPSIPVVFALAIDPVGLGHVQSLSRPGGNFTGFTFIDQDLIGKWMELLNDVSPGLTRAAVVFNPRTFSFYDKFIREIGAAQKAGPIELVAMPVGNDSELDAAIKALALSPGSALMIGPDPFNQVRIKQLAALAADNRLPAVSVYRPFAAEGGLMTYGPDTADIFRRAAGYVDRVLKGAKPADLPVQRPDKFELTINARAAKALGLEVPARLLSTAEEIIE